MPDTMMCAKIPMPEDKDHPYYNSYDCPVSNKNICTEYMR